MGWLRVGGSRIFGTVVAACAVGGVAFTLPAAAASTAAPAPPTTVAAGPSTTTLPPLPSVPPQYTSGQPAQSLLNNAVALSSLGLDNSALVSAVAVTQAKLDSDAVAARHAHNALAVATAREQQAKAELERAEGDFASMAGAVRQAVIFLYINGPQALAVSPTAGEAALFAQAYASSTVGPYGVLVRRQAVEQQRAQAVQEVDAETRAAAAASRDAAKALADQQVQLAKLQGELAAAGTSSTAAVAADHVSLAGQAGKELLSDSALQFTPKTPLPAPVATTSVALTWAFAELGREYVWGATGPDTFDCSGLTQFVWKAAGVSIPRVAADQDSWTIPVPLSDLLPGDLVFFGTTDIHHVGIYIGNGLMINAPHTGTVVQVSSIWWSDLAGFGRVHAADVPVPPHNTPSAATPAPLTVVATAGPVPSQSKPPPGWLPKAGATTPVQLTAPAAGGGSDPTSTTLDPTATTAGPSSTPVDPTATVPATAPAPPPDGGSTTTTLDPALVEQPAPTSVPTTSPTTSITTSTSSTSTSTTSSTTAP